MAEFEQYLDAATRPNTQRSYRAATKHFEEDWGGYLPASPQNVAEYLARYAGKLSINTLRSRLAALARWHKDQGFDDPTRASVVRQTLKGIALLHPAAEKQAVPLHITRLTQVADWLEQAIGLARASGDRALELRCLRDRAMILLGFWRGFRGDELISLCVEHVTFDRGRSMTCFLPRSKTDHENTGRTFSAPALSRWCPVAATQAWIAAAQRTTGPLFPAINAWGHLAPNALHPNSVIPLLRGLLAKAGLPESDQYTSHSLRRGFASWANESGWDLKSLMDYVGWKDAQSAMRYIEPGAHFARDRMEAGIAALAPPVLPTALPPPDSEAAIVVTLSLSVSAYAGRRSRRPTTALRLMQATTLATSGAHALDRHKTRFRLRLLDGGGLDETVADLLDDLHRIAENHQCLLTARVEEDDGERHWE